MFPSFQKSLLESDFALFDTPAMATAITNTAMPAWIQFVVSGAALTTTTKHISPGAPTAVKVGHFGCARHVLSVFGPLINFVPNNELI